MKILNRVFNFLASIELAVSLLLVLSVVLAAGTIVESKYGLVLAQQIVYQSLWNQGLLWLLLLNVAAVALSRLPWKRHHIGFLITHLGIIVLLFGSFITSRFGVDGILALAPGESGRLVRIDENYLNVFRAVEGQSYELVNSQRVEWSALRPLSKEVIRPLKSVTGAALEPLHVKRFFPRALRDVGLRVLPEGGGVPAVRIRLQSVRAELEELIFLQGREGSTRELGPARVRMQTKAPTKGAVDKPTLYIVPSGKALPRLYTLHPTKGLAELPPARLGEPLPIGWMDFHLTLVEYHPSALPEVAYEELPEGKTPPIGSQPVEAMELALGGETRWLELGASAQIASNNAVYYMQFVKRTIDLGFEVKLKDFQVGYYPGTNRAMTYSSLVGVGGDERLISMNEPMTERGFTLYQSSYESDEDGKPVLSVFSVNRDPGRWVKYSGCLMIVLGIISMFYFKPQYSGSHRWFLRQKNSGDAV